MTDKVLDTIIEALQDRDDLWRKGSVKIKKHLKCEMDLAMFGALLDKLDLINENIKKTNKLLREEKGD